MRLFLHHYFCRDDGEGSVGSVQGQGCFGKTVQGRQTFPWKSASPSLYRGIPGRKDAGRVRSADHLGPDVHKIERCGKRDDREAELHEHAGIHTGT